jgi:alpha-amylase/alpha-mannosidase (GH57 family)
VIWTNFFHIYQPPSWPKEIIKKVTEESYRPIVKILKNNPQIKITLNICASLTEQLVQHNFKDVIDDLILLANRGQIEFTGSAKYHTILPLLPKEEILRQIKLNNEVNEKLLGKIYKPRGFFSPEMCYSKKLSEIIMELGFKWIILDEIAYNGKLRRITFNKKYCQKNGLSIIFRNRNVSDYIAFTAPADNPRDFDRVIKKERRSTECLITAMDGENMGHHRPKTDKLWERLVTNSKVKTLTCSELLDQYKEKEYTEPIDSSWSSQEDELRNGVAYNLWSDPNNEIHQKQWQLTYFIIKLVKKVREKDPNYQQIRNALDMALASDQYWWASANPWWSLEIIKNETKEFLAVIKKLKCILKSENEKAQQLADQIIQKAENWQKTGKAQFVSTKYLKKTHLIRYMGGERIK